MSVYHKINTPERGVPPVALLSDIACGPEDTAFFFADENDDNSAAMKLCRRCPHSRDCLEWALLTNQQYGIWGGMTANRRNRLRRALKLSALTAS